MKNSLPKSRPATVRIDEDLIRSYCAKLGSVPLLTREGEVALAKRIEDAETAVVRGLVALPAAGAELARIGVELRAREEQVLRMRFGIDGGVEHTLAEIGESFDLTRERIRQIETQALRRLRLPTRARRLRAIFDR